MPKLTLLPALASALALFSQHVLAAPAPIGGFVPAGNDTRPVVRADSSGKLQDSLLNERGQLLSDARIVLESRQSPGFAYGSQKVSARHVPQDPKHRLSSFCLTHFRLVPFTFALAGTRSQHRRMARCRALDHTEPFRKHWRLAHH